MTAAPLRILAGSDAYRSLAGRHARGDAAPAPARQPAVLAHLRLAALRCRVSRRADPRACTVLDPKARAEEAALRLAALLPQALLRRPVLHAPGAAARSFDESWLVSLAEAEARGDEASVRFLLRRRVRAAAAPLVLATLRSLLARLAREAAAAGAAGLDIF